MNNSAATFSALEKYNQNPKNFELALHGKEDPLATNETMWRRYSEDTANVPRNLSFRPAHSELLSR
jgi:hypothetical protein